MISGSGDSVLVLGGPGTGKTTALVGAVVDAIGLGSRPLILARNRQSAAQLTAKVATALQNGVLPPIMTTHALALSTVREFGGMGDAPGPRMVDAASQERRLREILRGSIAEGRVTWPTDLADAVGTEGFAAQLRLMLAKADKLGMTAEEFASSYDGLDGRLADPLIAFITEYQDVLDAEGVIDYSDVVSRAAELLEDQHVRSVVHQRYDAVFVDEFEDMDAAQRALLLAVRAPHASLQAFADPDQSVDSFRGGGFVGFEDFSIEVLKQQHRYGQEIADVAQGAIRSLPLRMVPPAARAGYRQHEVESVRGSQVQLLSFDSSATMAEVVVDTIRRARFTGQIPRYSDAAVITRGSTRDLLTVENALRAAGIPVNSFGSQVPLVRSRVVQNILELLRLATTRDSFDLDDVAGLLTAPAFDVDPLAFRMLARQMRRGEEPAAFSAMYEIVKQLRADLAGTAAIGELVWTAIESLGYPIDGDEVVDLLDLANTRDESAGGRAGLRTFIDDVYGQRLAPRKRRSGSNSERDGVCLTTAHQSRGREWDMVFVCDLQEGRWPQLRRAGNLFESSTPIKSVVEEERRLFYVACTRAKRELFLASVGADAGDGEHSRFFMELAGRPGAYVNHHLGGHSSPLTTSGIVAALRRATSDESASPALRQAARDRLTKLSHSGVASANADRWWGVRDWTTGPQPVRDADAPIRISGSSWESLDACSLRWFFEHEVNARTPNGPATNFGTVIHAVADSVARGDHRDDEQIEQALAASWPSLGYEASWLADREFAEAVHAIRRFREWHQSRPNRRMVATEVRFDQELSVPGDTVRATGVIDRLEVDEEAGMFVIDLKTKRKAETKSRVADHRQLSLYQAVVSDGDLSDGYPVAGAELVQLRIDGRLSSSPKVQEQARVDVTEVRERLAHATAVIRSEDFRPSPSAVNCRVCPFTQVCPATTSAE